jgi:hypothetical protein
MIKLAGSARPITSPLWVSSTTFPEDVPVMMVRFAMEGGFIICPRLHYITYEIPVKKNDRNAIFDLYYLIYIIFSMESIVPIYLQKMHNDLE